MSDDLELKAVRVILTAQAFAMDEMVRLEAARLGLTGSDLQNATEMVRQGYVFRYELSRPGELPRLVRQADLPPRPPRCTTVTVREWACGENRGSETWAEDDPSSEDWTYTPTGRAHTFDPGPPK